MDFSFTMALRQKRSSAQAALKYETDRKHAHNSFGPLPQLVIMNEKPLNHEKTTSRVICTVIELWLYLSISSDGLSFFGPF